MYIEARSRAVHACALLSTWDGWLPFGRVEEFVRLAGGPIPTELYPRFLNVAARVCPNEAAALVVWRNGAYELVLPSVTEATSERISYSARGIDPLDVVVDLHSHGRASAYFSQQDDRDDLASPSPCFFAAVFGELNTISPVQAWRLVINGWESVEDGAPSRHLGGRA
jgi:PRTRC genetic system protein A